MKEIKPIKPTKPTKPDPDTSTGGTVHTSHTPKITTNKTTPKVEVEPVVDPNSLKGIED
nr:MAG TPA: hypothetical protein [Caudoviricetes sp.]